MELSATIRGTGAVLPGTSHRTVDLAARAMPERDPQDVVFRTGIETRHWAGVGDTVASIGAEALRLALADADLEAEALQRVILVNSTGGDHLIPATANSLVAELGLAGSCDCFDLNNACTGYLSALDLASRCVATGSGPVAVVAVETLSRFLSPESPRPYVVLADAAGAAVVGSGEGAFIGAHFGNDGRHRGSVYQAHPGLEKRETLIEFASSNKEIGVLANRALKESAEGALAGGGLTMAEVDWVVPHQPNGRMLERIAENLEVAPEKLVPVVVDIGSVGAASVAVGLDRLRRTRDLRPGQTVLMVGVGAGVSYGALLYRV